MATLFVLGNGFDLQHGLPTKYDPHLKDLVIGAERFPGEWESYGIEGDSWSRVEESLAELDVDYALEHLESWPPDLASVRESDRDAIIHEAEQLLGFPLVWFAENADAKLADTQPQRKFCTLFGADDFFLTFNYTHTLERLYGVDPSRVLHLHGEVGVSTLILGYAPGSLRENAALRQWDDEENFEFYRSRAYGAIADRLAAFEKTYQLESLRAYTDRMSPNVERVLVYGHSFGVVDRPYFEHLARMFSGARWGVRAHSFGSLVEVGRALDDYRLQIAFDGDVI